MPRHPRADRLAVAHATYYLVGGAWPLLHMRSFEAMLGPKHDDWLVRTVALLMVAIGAGLARGAGRQSVTRELKLVGMLASAGMATIGTTYAAVGRISPLYLLDAAVQWLFSAGWAFSLRDDPGASS
jgi:hypothetical protein